MSTQTTPTDLEEFDQGWLEVLEQTPFVRLVLGLAGLTRLGERPASLERLATILDRSTIDTVTLIRENTTARIEDGLIHWDDPYPGDRTRRTLYVGGRQVRMKSGCAPDLFLFTAVLDVPFRVEDTCAATGAPIRIDFVPNGYGQVDPPETVTALVPLGRVRQVTGANFEQINTTVCTYQPFFASPKAAQAWLTEHPGGRVFTVQEMFERPWLTYYRENLRPLVHPESH
jgi:alkylmercury lyase